MAESLVLRGCNVLIMARNKTKDAPAGQSGLLRVEYLIPDFGPWSFDRVSYAVYRTCVYFLRYPVRSTVLAKMLISHLRDGGLKGYFRQYLRHLPFVNKHDFDIIHAQFLGIGQSYLFLKKYLGKPYFVSGRGTEVNLMEILSQGNAYALALREATRVHVVSETMKNSITEKGFTKLDKVFVNRPAVRPPAMLLQKEAGQIPVILSVGRLVWIKGYGYLLEAYRIIMSGGYRFTARIVGDGPLSQVLKFSIQDLGLQDNVTLLGAMPYPEIQKELTRASVFVLSSHAEGISNAALEAMSYGVAVSSTCCGGMAEVIEHGVNGLLTPIRDPASMAKALIRLIEDPLLRQKLGKNARQTIEREYTLDRQAAVFIENYKKVIA
jgi:colanic acid/amylovoran biosynthesis glycosyltransferase